MPLIRVDLLLGGTLQFWVLNRRWTTVADRVFFKLKHPPRFLLMNRSDLLHNIDTHCIIDMLKTKHFLMKTWGIFLSINPNNRKIKYVYKVLLVTPCIVWTNTLLQIVNKIRLHRVIFFNRILRWHCWQSLLTFHCYRGDRLRGRWKKQRSRDGQLCAIISQHRCDCVCISHKTPAAPVPIPR